MDPRMYPLATYLAEIRQDWFPNTIQAALSEVKHLAYDRVAVGAVRAACDPKVQHPREIPAIVRKLALAPRAPEHPRICNHCAGFHEPGTACIKRMAGDYTAGAAAARAALQSVPDAEEAP